MRRWVRLTATGICLAPSAIMAGFALLALCYSPPMWPVFAMGVGGAALWGSGALLYGVVLGDRVPR